jgi:hypothetical protein
LPGTRYLVGRAWNWANLKPDLIVIAEALGHFQAAIVQWGKQEWLAEIISANHA